MKDLGGAGWPRRVHKNEGFDRQAGPGPVDKSEGCGERAGPGLAGLPYLANPHIEPKHELSIPEDLSTNFVLVACALQWRQHAA